ncbi:hypothetical protein NM208_g4993 [Fusarium decemcellulare]|uniref:Uncharacterized protein n=1 Tax=Fusarium decemcellulare TaxID=57161 RepID=A0ACC1SIY2_9HYPO|nr:hypothetical protein NM208_g4993 [Fusarium decemcellulare]
MVSLNVLLLSLFSTLVIFVSAESRCRCGDAAYLAIPRVNLSATERLAPCAPYKLIDSRGSGEPQGVSLMFQIALERILANNTGTISQSVIYPAGFDQNITSGVQNVIDIIKYGQKDCPNQKYFFEALNKLDDEALGAVNSVVLVGNPYRIPGRRSNLDNYGHLDNRTVYGLFAAHSLQSNGSIPTYNENLDRSGRVIDICLDNDIVCAIDPECTCQLASDHMSYGMMQSVQDLIVDHTISRF